MSQLYRSTISSRLSTLQEPPAEEGENDDELEDSLGSLPSVMGLPSGLSQNRAKKMPNPAYAPISLAGYFAQALQVTLPDRDIDVRAYYTPPRSERGGVFVMHHGAGYSGASFACLARELVQLMKGEVGVLAFDARRHGLTTAIASDEDLSMNVLVDDLCAFIQKVFPDPSTSPVFMLVGHSMGGSAVVHASPKLQELKYVISGVAVLDVVEGTAMEALPHMHALLNTRPEGFDSIEEAIEWHVNTHAINNPTSARISVPSILSFPRTRANGSFEYRWRTPLRSTAPYWESWFASLSSLFLSIRTARLLVLAGAERLDTPLMIGQMQGKFWLEVMSDRGVGHLVHEDDPTRLAEILSDFWRKNERLEIKGTVIKRVGER
ncbi:Alpha/Beta hydrolase protein [Pisolithus orientalis]|uniref:Alpha/Beta hydrolase protein n=1 Tax=Pisolithus orientalis TaxID=936130 RepID=UPI002224F95B|nr:Alpha/Beta hydrolase protein [Pisolithus orientalis]KAI6025728.1 Alpha/Beta hydrolase protein [Pisolithus orientalis]